MARKTTDTRARGALRQSTPHGSSATRVARKADEAARPVATAQPAGSVDAYIASFPPSVQARLGKVRATIRKAAPKAQEAISYRIPAYRLDGTLIYFAGFAQHIGVYPAPRSEPAFRDELAAYAGGKGTVQFPHDEPLPLDLIRRIVKFRAADNAARSAKRTEAKSPSGKPGGRKPRAKATRSQGGRPRA